MLRSRHLPGAARPANPAPQDVMETPEVDDLQAADAADAEDARASRDRAGIQSIEVGSQLLVALTRASRAMALGDLARAAGMHQIGRAHV